MGLFGSKLSEDAGEWAATAMACMVFADGAAGEAEIASARGQLTTNPVILDSIGTKDGERFFKEAVDAIAQIPSAMLPTYEAKLAGVAARVKDPNEKNFAFAAVIAVSMGDKALTQNEHQMLHRFQKMLGATIPLPNPGGPPTAEVKAVFVQQHMAQQQGGARPAAPAAPQGQPHVHAPQPHASQAPAPQMQGQAPSSAQASQAAAAAPASQRPGPLCATCGRPTQAHAQGGWCHACQRMTAPVVAPAPASASQAQLQAPPCPRCGAARIAYPNYGPFCQPCRA